MLGLNMGGWQCCTSRCRLFGDEQAPGSRWKVIESVVRSRKTSERETCGYKGMSQLEKEKSAREITEKEKPLRGGGSLSSGSEP